MKNLPILLLISISFFGFSQNNVNKINGIVTDFGTPLANVNISIKGSIEGTQTDANGKYKIDARPRDVLVFSFVSMETVEIVVEDVTKILNIEMLPRIEQLDEVVVQQKEIDGQQRLALDYYKKKSIISTSYGFIDAETSGSSMTFIDGSELNSSAIDIVSALLGKIPGLRINQDGNLLLRGGGSMNNPKSPIFEIDGMIFTSIPSFLTIETIDRVAVMPGLKAAVTYGNIASGGVIVINMKGSNVVREKGSNKPYDQAKLRVNIFDGRMEKSSFEREAPKYILELKKATNVEDAIIIYKEQQILYGSSAYYYLAASEFFREYWKESGKEDLIIEEMKLKYADDPNALKALAYTLEEQKRLLEAQNIYIEIFKKRPSYSQSYRDLANIYSETGEYKKALGLYARYKTSRGIDTVTTTVEGIDALIIAESENLLALRKKELSIPPDGNLTEYEGIRVVFEWNNSEAEFDLQFVNPEMTYYIWSHTIEHEKNRIVDEKLKGYSSEQFLIDKSKPGKWLINVNYRGNKSYDPTYLKVAIYYNYGMPTQRREVKVYRLELKNVNQTLLQIQNN